jgi:Xaa-Pro aminopeptidase
LKSPASPAAFLLFADGRYEVVEAETYSIQRVIDNPVGDLAGALDQRLRPVSCVGVERTATPALLESVLQNHDASIQDATRDILRLRKRKHPDEVDEIRHSLQLCAAAYRAARAIIAPGVTELDIFHAMYAAVTDVAGSTIEFCGDFASGERAIRGGGAPTSRLLQKHDLFPLDLFPAPALYFGDTCRTFAAGGPTDDQLVAHEIVQKGLRMAESMVKPGVRAQDVYLSVKEYLDSEPIAEQSFWHHLGHGIGFHGHEAPRIIPGSDEVFEIGDVFTLEPGVYTRRLQGGIRLEDNYLITDHGLENLFAGVDMNL